ncbi:TonB-linked SusC/RagA family outer membrane protein [Parabacteroides sp. PFB2-12]|uniref:SusC/RagA family TonB-linked outer membrane protein n=1 Tax=unclassified Parabacteroides TaxID=2649774 RepID=UPI0024751016|nr:MULTISPECIES: TonB-dependent receptor [unclassified Parabacteroides]MDH6343501.1 TonB-linked SusC/RagA family outer membrane protein [Parabacteroides sp. PM6-13]MDH6390899.1 TonB-linked SusC/RagA family outer membrane protein [Parabacteroides sp. PFB2-12]
MKRKNHSFRLWSVILFLCASSSLWAQLTVKGLVQDANQEPIIGANVLEVGTMNGVTTDIDGLFTLTVSNGANLQFSYVGMQTHVEKAAANMTITMQEDSELLDEVVVVGYGTTKRKNFTGSVSTFKVSEGGVALTAPNSALDMLRGIAPGLSMSQSGVAGASASIQIRGQKSINGGSDPLIVLDGVIFKGSINDISPDIVESMSVMKDATSLAAYGSQAANGVIMITTKKGEKGKPMINFRGSISLSESNYKPDIRDGYEYIDLINARTGREAGDISWMGDLEKANYEKGEWTDWYDFVSQTGVRQDYALNISGGTDNMDYLVGASYMDNKNFIKGNTFVRETVNARVNTKITKYIRAGLNFNFANMEMDGIRPSYNRYYSPWGEPYMEDGKTLRKHILGAKEPTTFNPLWGVDDGGVDAETRINSITLGGEIEVKIPYIDGLSYKLTGSYTNRNINSRRFNYEKYYVNEGEPYTSDSFDKHLNQANGYMSANKNISYVFDNILTYTREFGDHFLNATLVYTRDSNRSEGNQVDGSDFAAIGNTTLGFYGLNNASSQKISEISYTLHNNVGYLGRASYSFKDTYHFNASVRRDGSSVFGADKKWGTFPAVGVAWTISNEKFWSKIPWMSDTKLKASWGKNGNQSLRPYGTLSTVTMGKSGGYTYYFGGTPYFAQSLATLGNPLLGWETTTSWNFGVETDFLKGRLHFELDAYTAQTTDQIFNRTIPVMGAGISSQSSTMGQINNWGIESTLRSINMKTKDFMWTTTLSFTMNRSILHELYGDGKDDITNNLFLNKSLGAIYGYEWIGIIQQDAKGDAYIAANGGNYGDPMYANIDNSEDGKITPEDRKVLGYDKENFRLSLANTISWKNWSLYFLFNGAFSGGGYGVAANNNAFVSFENMAWNNTEDHPWWTPENKTNKYLSPNGDTSKFVGLQSYGFVRLQDLNISYNFRSPWLKKMGVAQLQLYASGSNLFFIAPGWDFSDPEVRSSRSQQLPRSYTFGMNLRF